MRKKILSMMLTICMVLTLMTQMSFAETLTYGDFEYSVSGDNKVTITEYTGKAEEVEIPSQIDGKQVTAIGESAFALGYSSEYVKKSLCQQELQPLVDGLLMVAAILKA